MLLALSAGHHGDEVGVPHALVRSIRLAEAELTALLCWRITSYLGASQAILAVPQQDLHRKIEVINSLNPALAVEIHINSFADEQVHGFEILYYTDSRKGKLVAQSALIQAGMPFRKNRGIKPRSDLAFLRLTTCPAIIIECGFISNKIDRILLQSGDGQDIIAQAASKGIQQALETLAAEKRPNTCESAED